MIDATNNLDAIREPVNKGECNRCHSTMNIADDCELTALCHDCIYDAADDLIAEVERLRGVLREIRDTSEFSLDKVDLRDRIQITHQLARKALE